MYMPLLAIINCIYLCTKTIVQTFHRRTLEAADEKHIVAGRVENLIMFWQSQNSKDLWEKSPNVTLQCETLQCA